MRRELFFSFLFVIFITAAMGGVVAVRTATNQFETLMAENNQDTLDWITYLMATAYEDLGGWNAVNQELAAQYSDATQFLEVPEATTEKVQATILGRDPDGYFVIVDNDLNEDISISIDSLDVTDPVELAGSNFQVEWFDIGILDDTLQSDDSSFVDLTTIDGLRSNDIVLISQTAQTEPVPPLTLADVLWAFQFALDFSNPMFGTDYQISFLDLLIDLQLNNLRLLVADAQGEIVVDSEAQGIGQRLTDEEIQRGQRIWRDDGTLIGTVVIALQSEYIGGKQQAFVQQITQGILWAVVLSGMVALLIALWFAYRTTQPIHNFVDSVKQLEDGQWGYQIQVMRHLEFETLRMAFNRLSHNLEEQKQLRIQTSNDIAHELNTPLNLLRLEVQSLVDGLQKPEEVMPYLDNEIKTLSKLINDLLFLTQGDTAQQMIDNEAVDLNSLVSDIVQRLQQMALNKSSHIQLELDDVPSVFAQVVLLERAISNLITNAIQHTPARSTVTVVTEVTLSSVLLHVKDDGDGIPPEHIPHIFERFYRVDGSRSNLTVGRGLGLAITRHILTQFDGEIRVTSEVGKGACFTIEFRKKYDDVRFPSEPT